MWIRISPEVQEVAKYAGIGAITAGIAALAGATIVPAAAVGFGSVMVASYLRRHGHRFLPVAGEGRRFGADVEDAGAQLLRFMRAYGVPNYPCQPVADFQAVAGLPVDGRYTRQVQRALAMSQSGPSVTIPNPLLQ